MANGPNARRLARFALADSFRSLMERSDVGWSDMVKRSASEQFGEQEA
jgi:hypothetical protein